MGRKRLHPKTKPTRRWYQKEDEWGNFVFDWSLGLTKETWRIIFSILIIILGVTILLGFAGQAGSFGGVLSILITRLFGGLGAYIFDFAFIFVGYRLILPPKEKRSPKDSRARVVHYRVSEFLGLFLLVLSVPTFIHLMVPEEIAKEVASLGHYGGEVGCLISLPLRSAIGDLAAYLLSVSLIAISILMIFDFKLLKFLGFVSDESKDEDDEGKINVNRNETKESRVSVFEAVRNRFARKKPEIEEVSRAEVIETTETKVPVSPGKAVAWKYPDLTILKDIDEVANPGNIYKNADAIQKCLETFNIKVQLGDANVGPTVTQYTLKPDDGVKLNQIVARQNDLALALAAKSIRIEAPIPGKNAVGIEIPNKVSAKVSLKEILAANQFRAVKSKLALALGRDVAGEAVAIDLEKMPHMLIAGATGSGKSVCINSVIVSLLFNNSPADLRLILVDPKRVEMTNYNSIPHLLTPVVIEVDRTIAALKWAVWEMERRYKIFNEIGKRNIAAYNAAPGPEGKMPYIVIIIDELADLMATSAKEVEGSIVRLAQMARATGMHLIIATQRPSVDVLTGLIKANIPSRIAFATASQVDSRTILDLSGAEKLLGFGDMLYMAAGQKPRRIQGCYVSDNEIEELTQFLRSEGEPQYNSDITSFGNSRGAGGGMSGDGDGDDMYDQAIETCVSYGKASASLLQRRLKVGYARAARLLDLLEQNGVIGPPDGAKPRDVLITSADLDSKGFSTFDDNNGSDINDESDFR
ncbi:MAG: DNA translocase FtsK 4TM domain-containing protein [Candidatus Berkelbacteria bacterium]|nr:DNA translocase FtsK 4TM domain-containing protein [Candidatus Berkelbacteria bacterium]